MLLLKQYLLLKKIANGNLNAEVRERSEKDRMMKALNLMTQKLNQIMNETNSMIQAVGEGNLDTGGMPKHLKAVGR